MVAVGALRECASELGVQPDGLDGGGAGADWRPASAAAEDLVDVVAAFGFAASSSTSSSSIVRPLRVVPYVFFLGAISAPGAGVGT